MCGGRGAHDWLGEEGSTSGGGSKSALFVHICALIVCVCIYLRSASEEFKEHKKTQEHSAHFTCGLHARG